MMSNAHCCYLAKLFHVFLLCSPYVDILFSYPCMSLSLNLYTYGSMIEMAPKVIVHKKIAPQEKHYCFFSLQKISVKLFLYIMSNFDGVNLQSLSSFFLSISA
uniref:Uncharacterized protein n=1 Tax=Arundo donax TaxID=35708 RepID=A0A0A9E1M5_ARUDO